MKSLGLISIVVAVLVGATKAQFGGFFEQMFGGNGGHQHQQQPQNAPSDPSIYQNSYDQTYCENYLCPDTLACVHFPHHCPCAWESHEDKFEMAEGHRICASKGGFKVGETARKVKLARKGLL